MDRRPLLVVIALLIIPAFAVLARPVHADNAAWPVLLDANSANSNDALPNANFTAVKTFNVGAIIEANNTAPLAGVYAWQFAIIYDNTTVVPQGDPIAGQIADPAGPGVNFGSMTGPGQVNWAGRIAGRQGFGNSVLVDPEIDTHHNEIQVFFTLLSPASAVTISPVPSSSVKGNLLANIPFELIKPATSLTFSVDAAHTKFVDSNASSMPGIVAGPTIDVSIANSPPMAVFTATHLSEGDSSCLAVTGSACSSFAISFNALASSDSEGFVCGPVNCTANNAAGYFWDFGDGIQDSVNAVATCSLPLLVCNQGVIAIHDYGGPGTFTVSLRVIDDQGATGSARDALGLVILNNQPSHAQQEVTLVTPPLVVSVDCGTGQSAGKPFNCTVSATGGIKPYSGTGTFSVTEPVKGVFTEAFTVTDSDGVNATSSTSVSVAPQPLLVTVSCSSSGLSITAAKPFSCTVSATGGTAPYSGTGSFTMVEPVKGTFTESFSVTDANAQTASGSATINVTPQPLVVTVTCPTSGITTGKPFNCTVTSSGGTSPYAGTGEFSVTEHVKGSFTESFSVTDANGATAFGSAIVTIEPQPLAVQVACGSLNGLSATAGKPFNCSVSAVGGTTPYFGVGNFSVTEPVKGVFVEAFTVTDANGVSASGSTSLTVVPQPLLVTVTCANLTSSQVTAGKPFDCDVSATGGTSPYSGTGTFAIVEAVKGTFTETFTVTDANGIVVSGSASIVVLPQPLLVTVSCQSSGITAGKPFNCNVSATGGTSPYTGVGVFSVTEPVKGTFAETFSVSDSNHATSSGSTSVVVIPQPLVVTVSCGTPTAAPITSGKPFSCSVSAAGGSQPYTGTGTFTVTEPVKGSFTEQFSVTDANGLTSTGSVTVNVLPQPLTVTASCGSAGAVITAGKPFDCIISATGGSQPYSGTGTFSIVEPTKGSFTEIFSVTDANNIVDIVTTTVSVDPQPLVVLVICPSTGITAGKPFDCTVSASGGTSPYSGTGTFSRTEAIKGSKTESFTVIDANAVIASGSTTVLVTAQPLVVDASCPPNATAGSAFNCTVTANGGTGPYAGTGTFSKTEPTKGSKTESFIVSDANGASALASATVNVQGTPLVVNASCPVSGVTVGKPFSCSVTATGDTGPYQGIGDFSRTESTKGTKTETFTVTDANGVTATATASVTVGGQSLVVTVSCPSSGLTSGKPFVCVVSATGGTTPYSGTGTFQITESTKGVSTETFGVTDANGAFASGATSVTVFPQPLVVSVSCPSAGVTAGKPFNCTVSASGGSAPYLGTGSLSLTEPVKGLKTEVFTITDSNSQSSSGSAAVNVATQPLIISVSCGLDQTVGKPFSCSVSAAGGSAPYTGTGSFTRQEPAKGQITETFTVTDANQVSGTGFATVNVSPQPLVVGVICDSSVTTGKPFNCNVTASGGTNPYTGTGAFAIVEPLKGSRTESFSVTDANGIITSSSAVVAVAPQPITIAVDCGVGQTTGKPFNCTVSAAGGTGPYFGTGTFSVTEALKGSRSESFSVTDSNSISAIGSTTVNVLPQPLVVTVSCGSGQTAGKPFNCRVSANGGTSPYFGTGTFSLTQVVKGSFTESFTVTDANGKIGSGSVTVLVVSQPLAVTVACPGSGLTAGKPFNCTVSATGGTLPYSGTGSISRTEPVKGSIVENFVVTDANGGTTSGTATVSVTAQPLVISVLCPVSGVTAGKPFNCTVSASGGTGPYTGTGSFARTEASKGVFTESFTVDDSNGVSGTGSASVIVLGQPFVVSVTCPSSGLTSGKPFSCTVSAAGGTSPYTGTGVWTITEPVKGSFSETFSVTDSNGASATGSATVTIAAQPLIVAVTCPTAGVTVGKPFNCTVDASGGTLPYSGTGTSGLVESTKGLKVESFSVQDANGLTATGTATLTVAGQPLVVSASCPSSGVTSGKPFDCTITASGGTTPYTGVGSIIRTEAMKGSRTESFTITDANGASATAIATVIVVAQPLIVSVICPTTVNVGVAFSCDVSATGGTAPYSGTGSFSLVESAKGSKAESFSVFDANGVSGSGSALVSVQVTRLVVMVTCPSSGITIGKPFDCTVEASGDTGPYTGTGTFSRTEVSKGSKTESFTVTDANSVSASGSATVTVNAQPLAVSVSCPSSGVTAGEPFDCTVTASGGSGPYAGTGTFSMTEPTKGTKTESFIVTDANSVSAVGSATVNLAAQPLVVAVSCPTSGITAGKSFNCTVSATGGTGPYTGTGTISRTEPAKGTKTESFTVADANSVSAIGVAGVSVSGQPLVVTVICPTSGLTAGKPFSCTVSATGGTAPYTGTGSISTTEPTKGTNAEFFTVTDTNSVSGSGSASVSVAAQPLAVTVSCPTSGVTAGKPFNCTVSATGGTAPYTGTGIISRTEPTKGSKTESVIVTDANAVTASGSATVSVAAQPLVVTVTCPASGVTAGDQFNCTVTATGGSTPYTGTGSFSRTEPTKGTKTESFTVTDANAASATGSAGVSVAGQPVIVMVTCSTNGVTAGKPFSCIVSATGGTSPYTGTGTFSRTEPVKGTRTESFTVTDANGFTSSGTATVTVSGQPLVATVSCPPAGITVGKPFDCTVTASGGTSPYSGIGSSSRTVSSKGTAVESFTVMDANGVVATTTATVPVAPQPLVVTVSCPSNVTAGVSFRCSVSATGGTAPYSGTGVFPIIELVKGTYTESFTVTDANNSVASASTIVNVASTPLIIIVTCPASASIGVSFSCTVDASGDTGPYTGVGAFSVTENSKGNKIETFRVTDANGVSESGSATVFVQGEPLVVTVLCPSSATAGTVFYCTVGASGGTGPYTGTGNFSVDESGKGPRIESFTVVDANGSSASGSATVSVSPMPLSASFNISSNPTQGGPVTFTATASGGTAPYTFIWDFGDRDNGAGNPATHTYVVGGGTVFNVALVVVDANGVHEGPVEESITVWVPSVGDFSLDTSPMSFVAGLTGTSHITVSSMSGFSNPVHLSYSIDHTGLSCNMSPIDLPTGAGSSTLSCQGSVGSYDVTVTGSSGSLTHSRRVAVTVTTGQPESPGSPGIFGLAPMWFYGGLAGLAIMLGSILGLWRRSRRNGKPVASV